MAAKRWIAGAGLGALVAAGLAASPALHAQGGEPNRLTKREISSARGGIGTFTPSAADPKLAAVLARAGLADNGFRFTPSESRTAVSRNMTVAVRARSVRGQTGPATAAAPAAVSLTPIAYNLGVSVGWKRFAVSGDLTRVDLAGQAGSREAVDLGLSYKGKRAGARVTAAADRPLLNAAPTMLTDAPSYSIDVGGSYSLTRNLDVTAGVRYKSERDRDRLPQFTDNRRDSQAVYVGTAFRF